MTVDELQVLITANSDGLRKEIAKVQQDVSGMQKTAEKSSANILSIYSKLKKGIVALGIGKLLQSTIKSAMDYVAGDTVYLKTMGEWKDATRDYTEDLKVKMGISRSEMRQFISTLYNTTTAMGVGSESAYKMSKSLATLSQDMGAFWNISSDEALDKLQSGLTGNAMALKQLGILVNDTTIKQVAYANGIAKTGAELTEQQKVYARYIAIMQQTGNMQGYLADTLNTPNAQLRMLKDSVKTLSQTFGQLFIPVLQAVLPYLNAFVKLVTQAVTWIGTLFGISMGSKMAEEMVSAGAGAGEIADNMANADKNAKKLKNTLAGFDEMNVLTEPTDSGGSGSGASGGGLDFALPEYDYSIFDNISSKADEIAEKMKKAFESVGEVIKKVWNSEPVQAFKDNVVTSVQFMGTVIQTVFERAKIDISKTWTDISPNVKKATDNILSVWTKLNKTMSKANVKYADDTANAYANAFSGVWSIFHPIITNMTGAWATMTQQLSDMWDRSGENIVNGLYELRIKFIDSFTSIATTIGGIFDEIMPIMRTGYENMSGLFISMFEDIMLGIVEWTPQILDGFTNLTNSILEGAVKPTAKLITTVWSDFWGILKSLWDKYGKDLVNNLGETVTNIIALFQKIWDKVIEPIITPLLETLSWLWEKHLKKVVEGVGEFIMKLVNGAMEIWNKFLQPIIMWLMDKLAPAWSFLCNLVIGVLGSIFAVVSDVFGAIMKILGGVIDFIVGIFTGNWRKAWDGVVSIFKGIIDGLVGILKLPINLIIDVINSFIAGLNKIQIPDWVPVVGGKGLNIPKIPKLASGGIIDRPTVAVVGEAGKEAVMPLERNTGWIDNLANRIGNIIAGRNNDDGQPIHLTVKFGEDTVLDKIIDGINRKSYERNEEVIVV